MKSENGVSIIIPVTERYDELHGLIDEYRTALEKNHQELQFVFVLDGGFAEAADSLRTVNIAPHTVEIITLTRVFGESAALTLGFECAIHDLIMTLPAYKQVDLGNVEDLFESIESADMVVVRRWPRRDARINRLSSGVFHKILQSMTQVSFRDLGCGVRLFRKRVIDEIVIYGDQHRFLPILADRRGFKVTEVDLPQATEEENVRIYRPGVYFSRLLDLMGVFFVVRFTKKPLRFFGMIGSFLMAGGFLVLAVSVMQRYLAEIPLADRPVLLLGSLLLVLGVQLFALGLIGELIIFTHAKDLKEYAIKETVNMGLTESEAQNDVATEFVPLGSDG